MSEANEVSGNFGRAISGTMFCSGADSKGNVSVKVSEAGLSIDPSNDFTDSLQVDWKDLSLTYRGKDKETNKWLEVNISLSDGSVKLIPDSPSSLLSRLERYGSKQIKAQTGIMWETFELTTKRSPVVNSLIFVSLVLVFWAFWSSLTWIEHFIVDMPIFLRASPVSTLLEFELK